MAVRLPCLLPVSSLVEFSFDLESGTTIEGYAQLRWANGQGVTGMEFRDLPMKSKTDLLTWLRTRAPEPASA
jgi:hypothetical protein